MEGRGSKTPISTAILALAAVLSSFRISTGPERDVGQGPWARPSPSSRSDGPCWDPLTSSRHPYASRITVLYTAIYSQDQSKKSANNCLVKNFKNPPTTPLTITTGQKQPIAYSVDFFSVNPPIPRLLRTCRQKNKQNKTANQNAFCRGLTFLCL